MGEEQATAAVAGEVGHQWAVVCTGFVDKRFNVTQIQDSNGNPCPVVVRLFPDEPTARKMLKRLQVRNAKVDDFLDTNWEASTPIYGLAETSIAAAKKRPANPNAFGRGAAASNGEAEPEKPARKRR